MMVMPNLIRVIFLSFIVFGCIGRKEKTPEPLTELSISNDFITLKVDLTRGGAINFISAKDRLNNSSLVNIYDEGRYVQQSYYAGDVVNRQSEGQSPEWSPWSWNPIQVGDYAKNRAEILESKKEGNSIYVKCIPMQWDMNNMPADAIMEQWTKIDGNVVEVKNRLTINSIDELYGNPSPRDQELPAVYPISALFNLYSYTGNTPFTKGKVEKLDVVNLSSGFWGIYDGENGRPNISEKWMAFVDNNNFGMAVYTPAATKFLAGMAGVKGKYADSSSTSYIAPLRVETLSAHSVYEYTYYLVIGDLEDMRNSIYLIHEKYKPI